MTPTSLPSCTSDDGSGPLPCHWDAAVQGNGIGRSFTVATDGTTTYDSAPATLTAPAYELCDIAGGLLMAAPVLAATVFVLVKRWARSL